jgi:hypothetical protein
MKAYEHLVRYALATAHSIAVWDGEEWATDKWPTDKSTNYKTIIEAIESVEEAELVIRDRATGSRTAWARVSAFGLADDETVIDYTLNDFTDEWAKSYNCPEDNDSDRLLAAARSLTTGRHGSFAAAIGDAATRADSTNLRRLAAAFPELFALETA